MITTDAKQTNFLDNEDRQRKVYSELVRRHGDSYKSLHWHSAFLQIGKLDGCSVLDVGCGIGDFAVYLEACGIDVDFTGYDIVPEAILSRKDKIGFKASPSWTFSLIAARRAECQTAPPRR